jgi:hypothetical protein
MGLAEPPRQPEPDRLMRFYFLIAPHEVYNDAAIYLAEGLRALDLPFFANRDFWREDPGSEACLFRHDPGITPTDCDVVVLTSYWFNYIDPSTFQTTGLPMPAGLTATGRRHRLVLIDPEDGYKTTGWRSEFRSFDLVLRPKLNRLTYNHANTLPWVHGFGSRVLRSTADGPPFDARRNVIVQNFGYTHGYVHGVRRAALSNLLPRLATAWQLDANKTLADEVPTDPWDQLMWRQTQRKHNPGYYDQLSQAQVVACFCGDFIPGLPLDPSTGLVGGRKARLRLLLFSGLAQVLGRTDRIIQWDSWRFWECLAAGSVALHVDLEKYGVALPIMPVNWQHYVGFDFEHLDRDIARFLALDTAGLAMIASAGRQWALDHYAPEASARRLLSLINNAPSAISPSAPYHA